MTNRISSKTEIDPVVIPFDVMNVEFYDILSAALKYYPSKNCSIKAIVIDSIIDKRTAYPHLSLIAYIEEDGQFKAEEFVNFLSDPAAVDVVKELMSNSHELDSAFEYLFSKIPQVHKEGRMLRTYHMPNSTVISMEYLEGYIRENIENIKFNPCTTDTRAPLCTFAIRESATGHQKVEAIRRAQQDWKAFKNFWPNILQSQIDEIHINDPDLSVFPETLGN